MNLNCLRTKQLEEKDKITLPINNKKKVGQEIRGGGSIQKITLPMFS